LARRYPGDVLRTREYQEQTPYTSSQRLNPPRTNREQY